MALVLSLLDKERWCLEIVCNMVINIEGCFNFQTKRTRS